MNERQPGKQDNQLSHHNLLGAVRLSVAAPTGATGSELVSFYFATAAGTIVAGWSGGSHPISQFGNASWLHSA